MCCKGLNKGVRLLRRFIVVARVSMSVGLLRRYCVCKGLNKGVRLWRRILHRCNGLNRCQVAGLRLRGGNSFFFFLHFVRVMCCKGLSKGIRLLR